MLAAEGITPAVSSQHDIANLVSSVLMGQQANTRTELHLVHLNARSVRSLDKFNFILAQFHPRYDVIILTETWVRQEEAPYYNVEGFDRVSFCRDGIGGGIFVFIRNTLRICGVDRSTFKSAESLTVELAGNKRSVFITAIYRPPTNNATFFTEELEQFLDGPQRRVIVGDLNIHFSGGSDAQRLGPLLVSYGYNSLINSPTRSSPPRTLDHIFTNLPTSSSGTLNLGVSDHCAIWCSVALSLPQRGVASRPRTNLLELRCRLAEETWQNCFTAGNVDECYETFLNTFQKHAADCTAKQQSSVETFGSDELVQLKKTRDRLWRLLRDSTKRGVNPIRTLRLQQEYKKARNRFQNRKSKLMYQKTRETVRKHQRGGVDLWKLIRRLRRSDVVPPISKLESGGGLLVTPSEICNELNRHFVSDSAFMSSAAFDPAAVRRYLGQPANTQFEFKAVAQLEVLSLLNSIGRPSAGYDGVRAYVVFHVKDLIVAPLTHIINCIISTARYPKALKVARVVPIYKDGNTANPSNYRPISVLPVLNKVVEKVLVKQMEQYLEANHLISDNQFGFRRRHSTGHAILRVVEETRFDIDSGHYCAAALVDLRRAFDSVRSDILLCKLSHLGFTNRACALMASYFLEREQFVEIAGYRSQSLSVTVGVPQGSCIGPLAFLCFINDLEHAVSANTILYADDTTLRYCGPSMEAVQGAMQADLLSLCAWCKTNCIGINERKTKLIVFSSTQKQPMLPSVCLNGNILATSKQVKLLGVFIDEKLSGSYHVEALIARLARTTYSARYLKNIMGMKSSSFLYNAYFLPHLLYGAEFWTGCSKKWLNRLHVAQGRFLRMFRGSAQRERTELGILDVHRLASYLTLLTVYRSLYSLGPNVLSFDHLGVSRITRATGSNVLKIRNHKSTRCSRAFAARAASEWNRLPSTLRLEKSYAKFCSGLKAYLLCS